MNKTKIEWCDYTYNPVTGCLHNCAYCYARKLAKRFGLGYDNEQNHVLKDIFIENNKTNAYPFGFDPTFHKYRLNGPSSIERPLKVFVTSMGDLFGDWVPLEWITEVFASCEQAPQHTYLFLTKNPKRYTELYEKKLFPYKENFYFGTTITKPFDNYVWFKDVPYKSFLSIEPLMEPLGNLNGVMPNWVIVGAETGKRKDKVIPKREWIENIVKQCKESNTPVFLKDNLRDIWGSELVQEYPKFK